MRPLAVRWLEKAEQDFREQVAWLEANRGHAAATRFLEEMARALSQLSSGLVVYRLVKEERDVRRCPVNKHLDLYHRLLENEVELLTFFDTRQDPDKLKL